MNKLTLSETTIRQDAEGRYSLVDLYLASGGLNRHRPSLWFANKQTKDLIEALDREENKAGIPAYSTTQKSGAYVVKELVYAYAMWISPEFHLQVIRAYDALVNGEFIEPNLQHQKFWFNKYPHWPAIRARVLAGERYRDIAAAIARSVGAVRYAITRMIQVGLLAPAKVAEAQRGASRRAALRRAPGWGQFQLLLALEG